MAHPDAARPESLFPVPSQNTPEGLAPRVRGLSRPARARTLTLLLIATSALAAGALLALSPPQTGELERALDLDAPRFESFLRQRQGTQPPAPPTAAEIESLAAALSSAPGRATRAALLLAASQSAAASEALLLRLEARVEAAERHGDAGDVTAAAALARAPLAERCAERLLELAHGGRPHPDLEVRTECAIAALTLGRPEAIDFLLRVLRIDTPSASRQGVLTQSATTAWPRGRAGEALCRAAGVPFDDWSDRSLAEREANADRLEDLLRPR
jgi:hypothetical protein